MLPADSIDQYQSTKIISLLAAEKLISSVKSQGKNVGICHGGFDLLHPGHMKHFESAKKLCDVLVVSVTSDQFVALRKGLERPILTDKLRAYSIACLAFVDYVVITDCVKGVEIIQKLKPSLYIKGPDYIHKETLGITAEREAIAQVGGQIKYTLDPTLSTSRIIDYIKNELDVPRLLIVLDRDGTLIQNDHFFGRHDDWKEKLMFNDHVLNFLSYLQTRYKTTKIVATNQSGIARGYFDCARVEEVNHHIQEHLRLKGINIDNWQYCPDVDQEFAESKKGQLQFNPAFVKKTTARKPSPAMVHSALRQLQLNLEVFSQIIVLGDREEDKVLAENLKAKFIDVTARRFEELQNEFA